MSDWVYLREYCPSELFSKIDWSDSGEAVSPRVEREELEQGECTKREFDSKFDRIDWGK